MWAFNYYFKPPVEYLFKAPVMCYLYGPILRPVMCLFKGLIECRPV